MENNIKFRHATPEEGTIIKTYSFKAKQCPDSIKDALNEYNNYYNRLSSCICSNLTTMTIGELASYIPEKKRNTSYYKAATDPLWRDKPLYEIFTNEFSSKNNFSVDGIGNISNVDNIILTATEVINPEQYQGNIFGISKSAYRTFGYANRVISNYKTKVRSLSPKVKYKVVNEDSEYSDILKQVIYEINLNNSDALSSFKERIEYLDSKEYKNEKLISRLSFLYEFYQKHTSEVIKRKQELAIEDLINFGGCSIDNKYASMTLRSGYKIVRKENVQGFYVDIPIGSKDNLHFEIFGRRDVIKDNVLLVDVINNHKENIVIKYHNGDIYLDITVYVPFKKADLKTDKIVGIDLNTKHMMLQTDIEDNGQLNGFVNVYKLLADDKELNNILGNDDIIKNIQDNSKMVGFVPIEYDLLVSRVIQSPMKYRLAEERVKTILSEQATKFGSEGKNDERIYLQTIRQFRENLKNIDFLKEKYYNEQKKYDIEMGFTDKSTESRDTMDKRRFDNPFKNTLISQELFNKINKKQDEINGNRDWLLIYAYKILSANGYNLIAMEELTSSSFEIKPSFPYPTSLLKKHGLEGKTEKDIMEIEAYAKHKDKYVLTFTNEKVTDITYSKKGKHMMLNNRAQNMVIKAIHFAENKNNMIKCANNGTAQIALVPPFYTSLIDSKDHKLFLTIDKKLPNKKKVRMKQELHCNGLNADVNAANNISYIVKNNDWLNAFCKKTDNGYNTALYVPKIKSAPKFYDTLRKLGEIKEMK